MSDDDQARSRADTAFIVNRMQALGVDGLRDSATALDAWRRAYLDLLRSGAQPSQKTLRLIAGELERLWWQKAYNKQQKRSRETGWLLADADERNHLAARYQEGQEGQEGGKRPKPNPRTMAEKVSARLHGEKVEALRKRRTRYRKSTRV